MGVEQMTTIELIALIISSCSGLAAILSFVLARRKDGYSDGDKDGGLKSDMSYIRKGIDEMRLDLKELNRKQDDMNTRLTRVEESAKQAHKRIDEINTKSRKSSGEIG